MNWATHLYFSHSWGKTILKIFFGWQVSYDLYNDIEILKFTLQPPSGTGVVTLQNRVGVFPVPSWFSKRVIFVYSPGKHLRVRYFKSTYWLVHESDLFNLCRKSDSYICSSANKEQCLEFWKGIHFDTWYLLILFIYKPKHFQIDLSYCCETTLSFLPYLLLFV